LFHLNFESADGMAIEEAHLAVECCKLENKKPVDKKRGRVMLILCVF